MNTDSNPTNREIHQAKNQSTGSATITLNFSDGSIKTFQVSGKVFGDLETGTLKIENENGSKFLFLPNPEFHTGKRKRRLKVLYNL